MQNKYARRCVLVLVLAGVILMGGCSKPNVSSPKTPSSSPGQDSQQVITQQITIYFGDDQAMYLVPEKREIDINKNADTQTLAGKVVQELIIGTKNKGLMNTIPDGTKLLALQIKDYVAEVSFSKEIQTNNTGGSAEEILTINSIVDSLTELQEIKQVQILINGQKTDTLAGHIDISQPLERDTDIIKK